MLPPPDVQHPSDPARVRLEFLVFENQRAHLVRHNPRVAVSLPPVRREQPRPNPRKHLPVIAERVDVPVRDATMQVRGQVVQVLGLAGVDVAGDVQVVVVGLAGDFGQRHHARVSGYLLPLVEHVHDPVDVALPQPVLGAVLPEALAGVDHEDAVAAKRVLLVDHHDARRDPGAVEKVGREPDDSLDPAALGEIAPDGRFTVSAEEHAVRHDDRALAGTPERRDEVQQVGVISVLGRRLAVVEAAVFVVGRVEAVRPAVRGQTRPSTESGEAPGWQGATRGE